MIGRGVFRVLAVCSAVGLFGCGELPSDVAEEDGAYTLSNGCTNFGDYDACLCANANLQGTCVIFNLVSGKVSGPSLFAPLPNDSLSSVALGAFVGVRVYPDADFARESAPPPFLGSPPWHDFFGNGVANTTPSIQGFDGVINDTMSSFRMFVPSEQYLCDHGQVPAGRVAIFGNSNYQSDCVVLSQGDYPDPFSPFGTNGTNGTFGLRNDAMSSILIGAGVQAILYKDAAVFQYPSYNWTLTSNLPVGQNIADLKNYGFNDVTSAMRVMQAP